MDRDTIISNLREWQAHRTATIRMQLRMDNQTLALIRRALGWQWDMDEKSREGLNKKAREIKASMEEGHSAVESQSTYNLSALAPYILMAQQAREPYDTYRKNVEKEMQKAVKELPIYDWWHAIRGVGDLGLALIIGECGDLSNYPNHRHLWKRLGLVPMKGKAASNLAGGELTAEEWTQLGYSPKRRSVVYTIGEAIVKSKGEYRELFDRRKREEIDKARAEGLTVVTSGKATADSWEASGLPRPEVVKKIDKGQHRTCGHIHERAKRYTEKQLLKHLWRQWVTLDGRVLPVDDGRYVTAVETEVAA